MKLSHDFPRMSADGAAKLRACLDTDCPCGGSVGTLRRRLIRASVTVHLQCDNCGRSRGAYKRDDHYFFQQYAEWDESISARYDYSRNETTQAMLAQRARETADAWSIKRREYAQFCRDNPDWHALRDAVIERAGMVCEACLSEPAVTAHHLTYNLGPLPPAWKLRAVCQPCHRRLHASKFGGEDAWELLPFVASLLEAE